MLGIASKLPPLLDPHAGVGDAGGAGGGGDTSAALQTAVVEPCTQFQFQGPLPVIPETVPIPQRFVGADASVVPLSAPQVAAVILAVQAVVLAPLVQLQFQGPLPVKPDSVPSVQRSLAGGVAPNGPLEPHTAG